MEIDKSHHSPINHHSLFVIVIPTWSTLLSPRIRLIRVCDMMLAGTRESELGTVIETRMRISPDASYRVSGKPALQLRQNLTTVPYAGTTVSADGTIYRPEVHASGSEPWASRGAACQLAVSVMVSPLA
jgi:hypothetical protein